MNKSRLSVVTGVAIFAALSIFMTPYGSKYPIHLVNSFIEWNSEHYAAVSAYRSIFSNSSSVFGRSAISTARWGVMHILKNTDPNTRPFNLPMKILDRTSFP